MASSSVLILLPLLIVVNTTVIRPVIEQSRGNSRIDYYGRVVDETGKGIPGVEVEFRIIYSGGPRKPGMFGRGENFKYVKVTSDGLGNFAITRQYGYVVAVNAVWHAGQRVGLRAVDLRKEDAPGYGVRMDDLASRKKLPDTPNKRVTCRVVPLSNEWSPAVKGRP